jgi:hypothetical protein
MTAIKHGNSWAPETLVPFQVVTNIPARMGLVQVTIVTELDNLFDISETLIEDGVLYCARLILDREEGQGPDIRRIRSAQPYVLGKAAVASIAPPHFGVDPGDLSRHLFDFDWGFDGKREPEAKAA